MARKPHPLLPDTFVETLVLVGVDANGYDRLQAGVYDFTTPCPPTCGDVTSVLATYTGCEGAV
jgi:hypothetical protein